MSLFNVGTAIPKVYLPKGWSPSKKKRSAPEEPEKKKRGRKKKKKDFGFWNLGLGRWWFQKGSVKDSSTSTQSNQFRTMIRPTWTLFRRKTTPGKGKEKDAARAQIINGTTDQRCNDKHDPGGQVNVSSNFLLLITWKFLILWLLRFDQRRFIFYSLSCDFLRQTNQSIWCSPECAMWQIRPKDNSLTYHIHPNVKPLDKKNVTVQMINIFFAFLYVTHMLS